MSEVYQELKEGMTVLENYPYNGMTTIQFTDSHSNKIGTLSFRINEDQKQMTISEVEIETLFRKQGYATKLMKEAIQIGKSKDVQSYLGSIKNPLMVSVREELFGVNEYFYNSSNDKRRGNKDRFELEKLSPREAKNLCDKGKYIKVISSNPK